MKKFYYLNLFFLLLFSNVFAQNVYNQPDLIIHQAPKDSLDRFGYSKMFGNFNNDEFEDLVVTAPYYHNSRTQMVGKAFIYYGSSTGLDSTSYIEIEGKYDIGNHPSPWKGIYNITTGDFNNDGYDDLVLGTDKYLKSGTNTARGYAMLFLSKADGSGLNVEEYIEFMGYTSYGNFAYKINTGDVNGDNIDDLIICAVHDEPWGSGKIYVYYGSSNFDKTYDKVLSTTGRQVLTLMGVGDVNGDGFDDVIATDMTEWLRENCMLQVWLGGTDMNQSPAHSRAMPFKWIHCVDDINNDSYDDIILSTIGWGDWSGEPPYSPAITVIKGKPNFDINDDLNILLNGHHTKVSNVDDINNDQIKDTFITVYDENWDTFSMILSGDETSYIDISDTLLKFIDSDPSYGFNLSSVLPGDMNGDGDYEFYAYTQNLPYKNALNVYNVRKILSVYLTIPKVTAFVGGAVQLPINISFPPEASFDFVELKIRGYHGKIDFIQVEIDSCLAEGWSVQTNETDDLLTISLSGGQEISGEGVLCKLKYIIPNDTYGFIPIELKSAFFNQDNLNTNLTSGGINILSHSNAFFVDPRNGSNNTGDGSRPNPWRTISVALDTTGVRSGPVLQKGDTLFVSPGTLSTIPGPEGWPEIFPIKMRNGISIIGQTGLDSMILDAEMKASIFHCENLNDSNSLLSNLTLKNSNSTAINCINSYLTISECTILNSSGGGIRCENSLVDIKNNTIQNNSHGISCYDCSPVIENNLIENSSGNGIYGKNSSAIIKNNIIKNNKKTSEFGQGGGIVIENGDVLIEGNTIEANSFTRSGTGTAEGGGIACTGGNPQIIHNLIYSNVIAGWDAKGGGIFCKNCNPTITENTIYNNNCSPHFDAYGGGIYCGTGNPVITKNRISNNRVAKTSYGTRNGGGIYCKSSFAIILSDTIVGNSGNGIYNQSDSSKTQKNIIKRNTENGISSSANGIIFQNIIELNDLNGIYSTSGSVIQNNVISKNKKSGIFLAASGQNIFNNIFYSNGKYGMEEDGETTDPHLCAFNNFFGNSEGLYYNEAATPITSLQVLYWQVPECKVDWYTNNSIDTDPRFVFTSDDSIDYLLKNDSPCIDTGHPYPQFNDTEDPENPGYALNPAMGALRSDIGAFGGSNKFDMPTSFRDDQLNVAFQQPENFVLYQNFPNPFNPETQIMYQIPLQSHVRICIYNINGQVIKSILDENQEVGYYSVLWDGTDDLGEPVSSGIYIYQITTNNFQQTKKMLLLH